MKIVEFKNIADLDELADNDLLLLLLCCYFTSTVNISGHVRTVNLTTLFLGRLRPPKRLTSTS